MDLFVTFIETSRGVSLVKNLGGVVLINLKGDCCNLLSLSLSLFFGKIQTHVAYSGF